VPPPTFEQKVTVPGPPAPVVDRPRLVDLFEAAVAAPVVVVHGPAGCGKTEAVAAWARSTTRPVVWATLDEADRDPVRLAATIRAATPSELRGPDDHDDDHHSDPAADQDGDLAADHDADLEAQGVLADLLARIAAADRELVLVLDDVARVRGSRARDLLLALLRYLPDQLRVVVVAGGRVPPAMSRLRVAGRLAEVDRADLRLRPAETAALVAAVAGPGVPAATVEEVHAVTEGHAAFVVAAARAVATDRLDQPGWVAAAVEPVLAGLPASARRLVEDLAPLPAAGPGLADAVAGRQGTAARLDDVARRTALVVPAADGATTVRAHRLVRRAVLGRMAVDEPERLRAIRRTAARWCEDRGDVAAAIEGWLEAGDDEAAWALLVRHHAELAAEGRNDDIARWLDQLPGTAAGADDPSADAAVDRAAVLVAAGRADEAAHRLADPDRTTHDRVRAVWAGVHLLWGDLVGALDLADGTEPSLAAGLAGVEARAQLGRFDEARRALLAVAPRAAGAGDGAGVLVPAAHAALAGREGRLGEAVALADQALAHAAEHAHDEHRGPGGAGAAWSHAAIGAARLERGDIAEAGVALTAADGAARGAGLTHVVVRVATARARARRLQGRPAEAFALLEAARRPLHVRPLPDLLHGWLAVAEARLHLHAGDAEEAEAVLDGRRGTPGVAADDPGAVVVRAWAALEAGDPARAQDLLTAELGPAASLGLRIEADLLRARGARSPDRARRHAARAVHQGAVDGYLTVFLEHRDGVVEALHDLRTTEPSPYLSDLLVLLDAGEGGRRPVTLTTKELAVLDALRSTSSIDAIAADLDVSVNTLKTHVKAVYRKLDATSRADAVRRALRLRLIGPAAPLEVPLGR
jgi:LuxR family maltose regulon positive regulatory protein